MSEAYYWTKLNSLFLLCLIFGLGACESQNFPPPKVYRQGSLLISVPGQASSGTTWPVVFFIGGIAWAEPSFLQEQTPMYLRNRAIFVYFPCLIKGGPSLAKAKPQALAYLNAKGLKPSKISLCGFSAGGPEAMSAEPENYACLALIDPVPQPQTYVRFAPNYILSFYRANWANHDLFGEAGRYQAFEELSRRINAAGGIVEETKIDHKTYLKYFLEKHGHRFL